MEIKEKLIWLHTNKIEFKCNNCGKLIIGVIYKKNYSVYIPRCECRGLDLPKSPLEQEVWY